MRKMYSHEIQKLLEIKKYLLEKEEYIEILNSSSQISYIKYEPYDDEFKIDTKDNYHFKFKIKKKESDY